MTRALPRHHDGRSGRNGDRHGSHWTVGTASGAEGRDVELELGPVFQVLPHPIPVEVAEGT